MKIISWNVNGIRSVQGKGFAETLAQLDADCILLQETKAQADQIDKALEGYRRLPHLFQLRRTQGLFRRYAVIPAGAAANHQRYRHCRTRPGRPRDGRRIRTFFSAQRLCAEFGRGIGSAGLPARLGSGISGLLQQLQSLKPLIACGDFNVAHREIDIARPKPNYNKSSGYTQVEIDGFSRFLDAGLVDTFRHFHPDTVAYSWWSFRAGARARNVGWRIDYVLTSKALVGNVKQAFILPDITGSDHCPVGIEIDL
jgi:exodeoxyribonuclease-3